MGEPRLALGRLRVLDFSQHADAARIAYGPVLHPSEVWAAVEDDLN